jgi:hypothetical protein
MEGETLESVVNIDPAGVLKKSKEGRKYLEEYVWSKDFLKIG